MKKEKEWKKTQNVKKSRNESEKEKGIINQIIKAPFAGLYFFDGSELNFHWNNPKDVDLYVKRMKPTEKWVEVRLAF